MSSGDDRGASFETEGTAGDLIRILAAEDDRQVDAVGRAFDQGRRIGTDRVPGWAVRSDNPLDRQRAGYLRHRVRVRLAAAGEPRLQPFDIEVAAFGLDVEPVARAEQLPGTRKRRTPFYKSGDVSGAPMVAPTATIRRRNIGIRVRVRVTAKSGRWVAGGLRTRWYAGARGC